MFTIEITDDFSNFNLHDDILKRKSEDCEGRYYDFLSTKEEVQQFFHVLKFQWKTFLLGYIINYKEEFGNNWDEIQVEASKSTYELSSLKCGTEYQIYLTSFNAIGAGLPSDIIIVKTKGTREFTDKFTWLM